MDSNHLTRLLQDVQEDKLSVEDALRQLKDLPFADLGFARIDHHRELRQGQPEVIFGQGKTVEQIKQIITTLREKNSRVLATRIPPEVAGSLQVDFPNLRYEKIPRLLFSPAALTEETVIPDKYYTAVVSAGTSDQAVAEEAAYTLAFYGFPVKRVYDVGVAGIHRLLHHRQVFEEASVIISVAGMEGALTSVVGGLVSCPVIGVPTSVGYGASFNGLAALLAMLNSCASGVAVVNIDNGFGAAVMAAKILRQIYKED